MPDQILCVEGHPRAELGVTKLLPLVGAKLAMNTSGRGLELAQSMCIYGMVEWAISYTW